MSIQSHTINSPQELETLTSQLATEDGTTKHHIHLSLFAPLAHHETLSQCRDHNSRYSTTPSGRRGGLTDCEYLNIIPLSQAWRQHWRSLPTTTITHVTFDMTLPLPDEGVERVRWNYENTQRAGVKIHAPDRGSIRLVDTLALEMYMRSKGKVKMDVVYEGEDRCNGLGMVRSYIEALETRGRSSREKTLKERTRVGHG